MNIGFIGLGKLGLPVALAVNSKGHEVRGHDIDERTRGYLSDRRIPYKEAGITPLLEKHTVQFTDFDEVVRASDIVFCPVQTPHERRFEGATKLPHERKDFDYSYLEQAVKQVADSAARQKKRTVLAVISTCLPGTFNERIKPLLNEHVSYVYTPQFIAMGTVLQDYLHPEFNLIGVHDKEAARLLESFYKTINDAPCLTTDITTAEGVKVSYNTFITMKTVLGNTWGELSHKLGMNVDDIFKAWSLSDRRLLSPRYLKSGVGDGGGCHPRDNIALSYLARKTKLSYNIFEDLMYSRERHMAWLADLAVSYSRGGLPIVVLGRSFKPETNIETGSPARLLVDVLEQNYNLFVSHFEDYEPSHAAVYVIGTQHERYKSYDFAPGSVVIDPFRYIPKRDGVQVVAIGQGVVK